MLVLICTLPTYLCFSQKVLVIKGPVLGLAGDTILARELGYDSTGNTKGVRAYRAQRDTSFIIVTDQDSLLLVATAYGYPRFSLEEYHDYPEILLSHIKSYPGDTIFISGLSFIDYPCQQVTRGYYFWRRGEQDPYHRIPVMRKRWPYRSLLRSIPYPHVQIAGEDAGYRLALGRNVRKGRAWEYTLRKSNSFYSYYHKELYFTFVIDLGDIRP